MLCDNCTLETHGHHVYLGAAGVWCLTCCRVEGVHLSPEELRRSHQLDDLRRREPRDGAPELGLVGP